MSSHEAMLELMSRDAGYIHCITSLQQLDLDAVLDGEDGFVKDEDDLAADDVDSSSGARADRHTINDIDVPLEVIVDDVMEPVPVDELRGLEDLEQAGQLPGFFAPRSTATPDSSRIRRSRRLAQLTEGHRCNAAGGFEFVEPSTGLLDSVEDEVILTEFLV